MPFSTSVIIGSAGTVTIESNNSFVCYVTWGSFISPFRWSRLWAPVQSPGDADYHQAVTITSEGSQWDLSNPATTVLVATLQGTGGSGAPVVAQLQVMASQNDTF